MPLTSEFNLDQIDRVYHRYNRLLPCLIRLNDTSFLVRFPGTWHEGVLPAAVRITWRYRDFASLMNRYDDSGFGWAFYSHLKHRVKYPDDLEPATLAEFLVRDTDIDVHERVREGNVQVSAKWYHNTMEANQRREVARERNIHDSCALKRNNAGVSKIDSPANKVALARKWVADEEEFQEAMRRQEAKCPRMTLKDDRAAANTAESSASITPTVNPIVLPNPAAAAFPAPASAATPSVAASYFCPRFPLTPRRTTDPIPEPTRRAFYPATLLFLEKEIYWSNYEHLEFL
ncbi:hypothetical protein B0H14DRAFT_3488538 [Mycena olivaceomarginata]|nr:hypothetical protein B0H14DRAFT_3488538 [Mycena olivaceomarginata]